MFTYKTLSSGIDFRGRVWCLTKFTYKTLSLPIDSKDDLVLIELTFQQN